ncbi:hypothetical protein BDV38DRAFT_236225 [Aspergillus pseudotamarii]|uniref:Uncharacterized protein n=1 Tax=Aspergillus pseudotamarii TaxID=132259 RepID=A0A5N6T7M4_ASPPS|nr:uncharacterized protein BDV38DRAFT_236225 [Aspergillus pseudotamarii]KAE8142260.1 hypothetical protein BDV38DRAFT_236225 [Aspergillus pseudotamarii]
MVLLGNFFSILTILCAVYAGVVRSLSSVSVALISLCNTGSSIFINGTKDGLPIPVPN